MVPTVLTPDEQAALPPIRPRWMAHVGGVAGAGAGLSALVVLPDLLSWLQSVSRGWDVHPLIADSFVLACVVGLAVPLYRLSSYVGFGPGTVVLLFVCAVILPFVGWAIGFRLVRIPYRDWNPSARQRPTVRLMRGAPYHVLQADLDRCLRAEDAPVAEHRTLRP